MKKTGHQPRLLTAVMEAIANLKEGRGSTQKKIIEQVQNHLSSKNCSFRNVMVQIRKALKHGVDSGLIKQKGGKFKLGLDSKDYVVFKNFQKMDKSGDIPAREHRRRGRRRRRRRSRRRRRRSLERESPDAYGSESGSISDSKSGADTPEPTDKGRRRRRRRRRRRGRRRTTEEQDSRSSSPRSSGAKDVSPKSSDEQGKSQKKNDSIERKDRNYDDEDNHDPSCGNPDCLCNMDQDINDPYRHTDNFRNQYDN